MSLRIAWATDVHLNFPTPERIEGFCAEVKLSRADALVISGDIAESHDFDEHLEAVAERLRRPIYFVLGNHDAYKGSIAKARARARKLSRNNPWLWWLPDVGVLELTSEVGLLGHDAWADGRLGDYARSGVLLNDYLLVSELSGITPRQRLKKLHLLGDEAAEFVREHLPAALERFAQKVVFVTHVPPFREACRHAGAICDDEWLPHFSCGAVGDALIESADRFPDRRVLVLCGHTHSPAEAEIRPNLRVLAGGAVYGRPALAEVFDL